MAKLSSDSTQMISNIHILPSQKNLNEKLFVIAIEVSAAVLSMETWAFLIKCPHCSTLQHPWESVNTTHKSIKKIPNKA